VKFKNQLNVGYVNGSVSAVCRAGHRLIIVGPDVRPLEYATVWLTLAVHFHCAPKRAAVNPRETRPLGPFRVALLIFRIICSGKVFPCPARKEIAGIVRAFVPLSSPRSSVCALP